MLKHPFANIKTPRLLLRKIDVADAPVLYQYWSDPAVTKHMNIVAFDHEEQAAGMIRFLNALAEQGQAFRWSIVSKRRKQVIGSCGFNNWDQENQRAEIGYELGQRYWGKGLMTEALTALIQYGYQHMNLHRIQALVEPQNIPSRRVLERLGFAEEGLLRQYERIQDTHVDLIMYAIFKQECDAECRK